MQISFVDLRLPKKQGATCVWRSTFMGDFWRAKYDLGHTGHLCAAIGRRRELATRECGIPARGEMRGGRMAGDVCGYQSGLTSSSCRVREKYAFDVRRVIVMGHSAGGQLALCLAAHESGVKAVISLAGVVDLQQAYALHLSHDAVVEFLGGTPGRRLEITIAKRNPMKVAIEARQWLVHGATDDCGAAGCLAETTSARSRRK